jgi:short-subunit dehydrogenase
MDALRNRSVILTGACGDIGRCIARFLAAQGANLFLVAYPGQELPALCREIQNMGVGAGFKAADLRGAEERIGIVEDAERQFGGIDILVNNAAVETSSFFHELRNAWIRDILSVNLEAPMMLTRLLLPAMLKRRFGHIVNISSLAGKSAPGFQEPYAASKAALIAFTYSLRGAYAGSGVSASVICPGFVEAGIYSRIKSETGVAAPRLLGTVSPERVARAVVRAIRRNTPEIIVNRWPVRPLLVLSSLSPTMGEWLTTKIGIHGFFRRVVEARSGQGHSESVGRPVPVESQQRDSTSGTESPTASELESKAPLPRPPKRLFRLQNSSQNVREGLVSKAHMGSGRAKPRQ